MKNPTVILVYKHARTMEKFQELQKKIFQLGAEREALGIQRDALSATCEEITLERQCVPGLAKKKGKLCSAPVGELEGHSRIRTISSMVQTKRKIADIEVCTKQACTERVEYTIFIVNFKVEYS